MMITSNVPTCHADTKFTPPTPHPQTGPKMRSTLSNDLLLDRGSRRLQKNKSQDFQGQILIKNQLISWKIHGKFQANFAEK